MNKKIMSTGLRWLWLTAIMLTSDVLSKQWIMKHLLLNKVVPITPCINLFYTVNPGAAFNFLSNNGVWPCRLLSVIAVVVVLTLAVIMYSLNKDDILINIGYSIIIGGALGNLFDRIKYGVVIDFIDIYICNFHWPTFNLADIEIFIGIVLVTLDRLLIK